MIIIIIIIVGKAVEIQSNISTSDKHNKNSSSSALNVTFRDNSGVTQKKPSQKGKKNVPVVEEKVFQVEDDEVDDEVEEEEEEEEENNEPVEKEDEEDEVEKEREDEEVEKEEENDEEEEDHHQKEEEDDEDETQLPVRPQDSDSSDDSDDELVDPSLSLSMLSANNIIVPKMATSLDEEDSSDDSDSDSDDSSDNSDGPKRVKVPPPPIASLSTAAVPHTEPPAALKVQYNSIFYISTYSYSSPLQPLTGTPHQTTSTEVSQSLPTRDP
jgi:hypothetical protein